MGNGSSIVFSGIAPHPPIMVPEVGRESIAKVSGSISAMAELTKRIISSGAETVLLISPHAPLQPYSFVAYEGPLLQGNFANFRAPAVHFEVPLDQELLDAIVRVAANEGYEVASVAGRQLDHGTAVPLYFLRHNGWIGGVIALGYSFLSNEDHVRFGSAIGKAISEMDRLVAIVASGDLSHRLKPQAPAGYNPTAYIFDDEVVDALRCNAPDRIINIDQDLRTLAGECGYRSMLVAFGATQELPLACEVLHYEAPFGVGYLVAQITNRQSASNAWANGLSAEAIPVTEESGGEEALLALAREAIETFVKHGRQIDPPRDTCGLLGARAACFVCLKTTDRQLRGCIGTIEPVKSTLAEELIANAINAATRDPRFSPVSVEELPGLRYSVDVLSAPEAAVEFEDLDPVMYGVIVEDESGQQRGLLLPDLDGVDTVAKQVAIAAGKAGISPEAPLKLSRFRVSRFSEK